tara:strand:+ start:995 stop:1399 length:405 start_codon:yes stop_codon:yes gene_type:complete
VVQRLEFLFSIYFIIWFYFSLWTLVLIKPLAILSDLVTDAHTSIQVDFTDLDPIVGVSQQLRRSGIAADLVTIDCLRSGKRIIMVLQDHQPELLHYQFSFRDQDPAANFEHMPLADVSVKTLYHWMSSYFLSAQ